MFENHGFFPSFYDEQKWCQLASFQAFFEFHENLCLFGSPSLDNGGIPYRPGHKEPVETTNYWVGPCVAEIWGLKNRQKNMNFWIFFQMSLVGLILAVWACFLFRLATLRHSANFLWQLVHKESKNFLKTEMMPIGIICLPLSEACHTKSSI